MQSISRSHQGTHSSPQLVKSFGACVLCRTKKLKCDTNVRTCANCAKASAVCMVVDPKSGREYQRGYIDDLSSRATNLRHRLRSSGQPQQRAELSQNDSSAVYERQSARLHSQQPQSRANRSDGSLLSLGNLVAAALSLHFPNALGFQFTPSAPQILNEPVPEPAEKQDLPPLSVACELTDLYFEMGFQKVSPFMQRKRVYEQIERLYDNRARTLSRAERHIDMFQLFMIFAVSASLAKQMSSIAIPVSYYATAMMYSDVLSDAPGDIQIQNTLLLLVFAHLHGVGIGSKWKLARQAMRISIQLGYHRRPIRSLDNATEQLQRRLFWCCYVQERFAACNLGWPIMIPDSEITVEMPDDTYIDGMDLPLGKRYPTNGEVSVLVRQAQLRKISTKVRAQLYADIDKSSHGYAVREESARCLSEELEVWRSQHSQKSTIPQSNCLFETVEYMDINYNRELLFIFSALALPTGEEKQAHMPDIKYLRCCLDSAIQIALQYRILLEKQIALPLWTHVQDMLRSGFMVLYCGLHLPLFQMSMDHRASMDQVSEPAKIVQAISDCNKMLHDISQQWPAVNPHLIAFERLSSEVKRLSEASMVMDFSQMRSDNLALPQDSSGMNDLNVQEFTYWDAPLDLNGWSDLLNGDNDMQAVFGYDFMESHNS